MSLAVRAHRVLDQGALPQRWREMDSAAAIRAAGFAVWMEERPQWMDAGDPGTTPRCMLYRTRTARCCGHDELRRVLVVVRAPE